MDVSSFDNIVGLFAVNRNLIILTLGVAIVGLLFAVGAFVYARWAHMVTIMILERVSQEQNARLHAMMRETSGAKKP